MEGIQSFGYNHPLDTIAFSIHSPLNTNTFPCKQSFDLLPENIFSQLDDTDSRSLSNRQENHCITTRCLQKVFVVFLLSKEKYLSSRT